MWAIPNNAPAPTATHFIGLISDMTISRIDHCLFSLNSQSTTILSLKRDAT